MYATAGTRKAVVKLDARTGELKWMYSMDEGRRADVAPRRLSGRGVSYWTDGNGDERIYLVTIGYRLVALERGQRPAGQLLSAPTASSISRWA